MNKQLTILTFLCLLGISSPAQYYWEWARSGATNSEAFGTELVTNPADGGQTYAGNFRGADITFQPAAFVTFPNPGSDPNSYIIHLDSDGQPLWSFYIGKTGNVCVITDLVHGTDGTLFVTGYFDGSADVAGTDGGSTILNSGSDNVAGFIASYSNTGELIWASKLASIEERYPTSIGTDGTNVFVAGYYSDSSLFDIIFGNPGNQAFVARYNVVGNVPSETWEQTLESWDDDEFHDLVIEGTSVYVTGTFDGNATFIGPVAVAPEANLTNAGLTDALVAKYALSDGTLEWSTSIGGPGMDQLTAIDAKDGFLYLAGSVENDANFPGFGALSGLVNEQICVAKIDNTTGTVSWAFSEGGSNSGLNKATDIIVTADNQVVISGWYDGMAEFSGTAPNKITTLGRSADPVVASYNTAGDLNWIRYASPSPSDDYAFGIAADASGSIYLTGSYNFGASDAEFSDAGSDITTGIGNNSNTFFAKLLFDDGVTTDCSLGGDSDFPAGSWIIPMDNDNQPGKYYDNEPPYYPDAGSGPGGTTPFNLMSYGLVNELLQNEIPIHWVIKTPKAKDEADIEAEAFEVYPALNVVSSAKSFVSGPFVIHLDYVALAKPIIEAYGNDVHVFETANNETFPVRYKLTFKPQIVIFDNGGIKGAEWQYEKFENLLLMAGFSTDHYSIGSAVDLSLNLNSCITFCAEAHWKNGEDAGTTTPYSTSATARVKQFVMGGGNFLAQCAGIEAYENYQFFQTTEGMIEEGDPYYSDTQKGLAHTELLPDDPFYQIHGPLDNDPTGTFVGIGISSGGYKYFTRPGISKSNGDQVAGSIKLTPDNIDGGHVFYLGGHDYRKRKGESKPYDPAYVNGIRMFLNAIFIPPSRPSACPEVSFCSNAAPCTTTITYPETEFCRTGADPIATIDGEGGGTFTEASSSVVFNDTSTGEIDLSLSARGGPYTILYTSPGGCEASFDIYNYGPPSVSDAGSNQALCSGSTATLNAAAPTTGTGEWSVISGGATVTDITDPNSSVTGLTPGMNTFRWTISNGPCAVEQDDVNVVVDNVAPIVACLISQTKNTNASCEYIMQNVTGTAAVTESCSYTVTQSIPVGTALPLGTHSVTITATDEAGNVGTCTTNLIVQDNTDPWFTSCPSNQNISTDPGSCGAVVSWVGPSAEDNCSHVLSQTSGPANGDLFPIGTTTVTYVATDGAGNTATCSFEVTVTDNEAPAVVNCPSDIFANTDAGSCDAVVSWSAPSTTDNCSATITQTSGLASGSTFPIGTSTIEYTSTDAAGNSSSCTFNVVVSDNESPVIVGCPSDIAANTDVGSCDAVVSWSAPTSTDNCSATISQTSGLASGSTFPLGTSTIEYTSTDAAGNSSSCTFNVVVSDNESPVIVGCPSDIAANTDAGSCDAVVSWSAPTTTDNCSATISQTSGLASGSTFPLGTSTIEYTSTDAAGNSSSCTFNVVVSDNESPVIVGCPSDIAANTDAGSCDTVVSWSAPSTADNCSATITQTSGLASGSTFPIGTSTIEYTSTDAAGNSSTCTFNVVVSDNESPVIVGCPSDIATNTDSGSCDAVVSWSAPSTADNCSATITQTSGLASGSTFPIGTSTIEYTSTDAAGNSSTCTFNVVVSDNESPVIVGCPSDIATNTDSGSCDAVVSWSAPGTSDNCSATITQTSGLVSGSTFPIGTSTIEYMSTDAAGNSSTCTFNVTVNDNVAPMISDCPLDIITEVASGTCGNVVSWMEPSVTDNCPGATLEQVIGPPSGDVFTVGNTTVSYIATDAAGLTSSCTFTVTVEDNEAPIISGCPVDEVLGTDTNECTAKLNWPFPDADDNCTLATYSQTAGLPSGSDFPIGTTINTFTAIDDAGNETTCSFSVTVFDDSAPEINGCPNDINEDADASGCGTTITWDEPDAEDNCGIASFSQTEGPANGSFFPVGTVAIVYTAIDVNGLESQCSFNVTVEDNGAPVYISCPEDMVIAEGQTANWIEPTAEDNCGIVNLAQTLGLPNGSVFPLGVNEVEYMASDENGNDAVCSFNVIVNDEEAPVFASCPEDVIIPTQNGICGSTYSWEEPTVEEDSPGTTVIQTQGPSSGSVFDIGTTTVEYVATDLAGNTSYCQFTVTVYDITAPVYNSCPVDLIIESDDVDCGATVSWIEPTPMDHCGTVESQQIEGPENGTYLEIGIYTVVYEATDEAGNTATCSFEIEVTDTRSPLFTFCTPSIEVACDPEECGAIVNWEEPSAEDCNLASLEMLSGLPNGTFFPSGTTSVVYEAIDEAGNSAQCLFTVTVLDTEPPQLLTGPENMVVGVSETYCSAMVVWLEPTGYDNCSDVTVEQTIGLYSGSNFQLGVNEVVYTFTDEAGNTAEWGFTITVIDDIQPVILTCPVNILTCDSVVTWEIPEAEDTCSPVEITQTSGLEPGATFPIGTTEISYTISDETGNVSTCTFEVHVLPEPSAEWTSPGSFCSNMDAIDLNDFVLGDEGGVFEGPGIVSGMFDPSSANFGTNEISYTVSNDACQDIWTQEIEVVEAVQMDANNETEFCGLNASLHVETDDGNGIWNGPEGTIYSPSQSDPQVTVTVPEYGNHVFTYTMDANGVCDAQVSMELMFFETPDQANAGPDQVLFSEYQTRMEATNPVVGVGTWKILEGTGVISDEFNPEAFFTQLSLHENVLLWELSNGNCPVNQDTVVVYVQDLVFPTGISPNNDGDNDLLEIKGIETMPNSLTVFDRWGKQVFQTVNYQNDWGGTTKKGKPLPEDTYFYIVDTELKQFSGYLVIRR